MHHPLHSPACPASLRPPELSNEWKRRPKERARANDETTPKGSEISDVADLFGSVRFFRMKGEDQRLSSCRFSHCTALPFHAVVSPRFLCCGRRLGGDAVRQRNGRPRNGASEDEKRCNGDGLATRCPPRPANRNVVVVAVSDFPHAAAAVMSMGSNAAFFACSLQLKPPLFRNSRRVHSFVLFQYCI